MAGIINGNPTKVFFIEMLTRDISIRDAIIDLLDNSIDGANSINKNDYSNLEINVTINKDEFIVEDNCGGFSLEVAQKYAFRFGRPEDAPTTTGTVGRFGVGMKRALFKMGKAFEVESKTQLDHFQVDVDVANWKDKKIIDHDENGEEIQKDDWNFNYQEITQELSNLQNNGTYIKVSDLYADVAKLFDDESFLNDLEDDIERILNFSLEKGITITLNGKTLSKHGIVLFNENSKPYLFEGEIDGVNVRVAAGLSHVGDPDASGWYIYCNNRLVVEKDKSSSTGWRTGNIPKWHVDYVMFKGVVFLDSEDTIKLPLTTTKKGIDTTSDIYQKTLFYMREGLTSVLTFLKDVRKLGSDANDYRKLLGEQEDKITVVDLKTSPVLAARTFVKPEINIDEIVVKKDHVRISYNANRELAELARAHSEASNFKQFGEYTFEYYLKMEEINNE